MDYAEIISSAGNYAWDGVRSDTTRWMKLIVAALLLGIPLQGYLLRVYRGANPAPEVDTWITLCADGIRVLAIGILYILPIFLAMVVLVGTIVVISLIDKTGVLGALAGICGASVMLGIYLLEFVALCILPVAYIRFARTGIFSEAFNFSALADTIGRIGWLPYGVAVVFLALVLGIPLFILCFILIAIIGAALYLAGGSIPVMAGVFALAVLVILIIMPVAGLVQARYLTRVYDSAGV